MICPLDCILPIRRLAVAGAVAVTVLLATPATAQPTSQSDRKPGLPRLVADLSASSWTVRQAAEDALVAMGDAAVEPIQAAIDTTGDVEARDRLRSALRRIARDALMRATPVTLGEFSDRPLEAFEALAQAAGLRLDFESDTARERVAAARLDLEMQDEPWLAAISRLGRATQMQVRIDEDRLILLDQPPPLTHAPLLFVHGAAALRIDSGRRQQVLDLISGGTSDDSTIALSVLLEPKLRLRNNIMLRITRLEDEHGRELADPRSRRIPLTRSVPTHYSGSIPLQPQAGATRIGLLEGELLMEVVTQSTVVRITDLDALPHAIDSMSGEIVIDAIVRTGNAWELQLRLPYAPRTRGPRGDAADVLRVVTADALKILDQDNRPLPIHAPEMVGVENGLLVRVAIHPPHADARPTSIHWTLPATTRDVRQPVRLADLPLP